MLLRSWKVYILAAVFCSCLSSIKASILQQYLNKSIDEQQQIIDFLQQFVIKHGQHLRNIPPTLRVCIRATQNSNKQFFSDSLGVILSGQTGLPIDLYTGENLYYTLHTRLYFVDSFEALRSLIEDERPLHGTTPTYNLYMIVLPPKIKDPLPTVQQIVSFCWEIHMVNVNIVIEDEEGFVTLYTYYPYTPQSCEKIIPIVHKRFDEKGLKLKFSLFPQKIKNFWGCPMQVVAWQKPPFVVLNHLNTGLIDPLTGVDGEILKLIAKAFNFTIELIPLPHRRANINESREAVEILQHNKASIAIGNLRCSYKLSNLVCLSDPYYMSNIRILLRNIDEFSSLEMIFLPFDLYTWLIIAIFFIGRRVCHMLYKSSRGSPFRSRLNMAVYLFSYLMIRSAYEGSIFKYLHKRPLKPTPVTLDDAINDGYRFLVDSETYSNMEPTPELNASLIVLNVSESRIISLNHFYEGKIGTFFLEDYMTRFTNKNVLYPALRKHALIKENIFSKLACIYLPKFSFLFLKLNMKLLDIRSHGLVQKFYSDFVNIKMMQNTDDIVKRIIREKPTTLGMEELMGLFKMYFILKGLCGAVFLLEVAAQKYRRVRAVMGFFH